MKPVEPWLSYRQRDKVRRKTQQSVSQAVDQELAPFWDSVWLQVGDQVRNHLFLEEPYS